MVDFRCGSFSAKIVVEFCLPLLCESNGRLGKSLPWNAPGLVGKIGCCLDVLTVKTFTALFEVNGVDVVEDCAAEINQGEVIPCSALLAVVVVILGFVAKAVPMLSEGGDVESAFGMLSS